ncbi:MAG: right-handed parallel beta-helix repeat-containing protein [Clostridia bacterium]|nr:right-handed parallel beta-helix repeat-containing protein [Clostridia bacterium]
MADRNTVYFSSFLTDDHTESFAKAMEYLRSHPYTTFVIEPGVYNITTPLAREIQMNVMSGKYGKKQERIIFNPKFEYSRGIDFYGQTGTVVEAHGVTIMVDGFMEPISLRDCEDVELCGLVIDHKRKPYSRGVVTKFEKLSEEGNARATIEFEPQCPIQPGTPLDLRYIFTNPSTYVDIFAEVTSFEFVDEYHINVELENAYHFDENYTEFYTVHTYHSRPAILIERASDIKLTDVTVHSQPGMGIVGNRSHNVTLSGVSVIPSIGHHMATNTDGTHFTSMTGLLRFERCTFEAQGDDFVNVHAYYQAIIERVSPTEFYMQEKTPDGTHAQSLDYPDVGDTLELTNIKTLEFADQYTVVECEPLPDEWKCRVVLDRPLPENTDKLVLADVTRLPRLEVVGCHARNHFARSILVKTRNALIENNHFYGVQSQAIRVAPEAGWYEGVAPANVVIRGNRIVNCNFLSEDRGAITVLADSEDPNGQCMKNIVIEDNIIECPSSDYGILVRNVDGLTVRRNKVIARCENVKIEACTNVICE